MNSEVKLRVENLSKVFGNGNQQIHAISDVSLDIRQSEFVMIVGPSDCGKTTLINIIGGLEKASSGSVLLDGRQISGPGADRGMVFQGYSLFPWLTVQKNVEFGLKRKNCRRIDAGRSPGNTSSSSV